MSDQRTESPAPSYAMASPYQTPYMYAPPNMMPPPFAMHQPQLHHPMPPHIQPYGSQPPALPLLHNPGGPVPAPQFSTSSALYEAATANDPRMGAAAAEAYAARGVTRLPPILQVEKQHVTTSATQAASASRRRNDAQFKCPVPGCGSTFTRRFNLRGHLRSHTEERPFVCEWPGCGKGFARQHDCKRHQALHNSKNGSHACQGCGKTFSRMDALNRHLRSDGGAECRETIAQQQTLLSVAGGGADPAASGSGAAAPGSRRSAESTPDHSSRSHSVS
ncbi:hypothetical protein AURDEDRAFT_117413 [Auricularia subglabra TFB-10046 SS5]|uniref:C2H2-type domain-containing protein n=1 Tax=Auricularia subglabra (strain TFB-10046 / SS5) TaxID=717982 RepID=J0D813_AURST|nr:hypothetical protein AURDEDRAFT_117413 [Auricularia subglabra TFB-10046 SS5]